MGRDSHHRQSLRLRGYDYAQNGAYFITIVTQARRCLFGDVIHGEMVLSNSGKMIDEVMDEIPAHYLGVFVDAYAVMPNHVHGLIIIDDSVGAPPCGCPPQPGQARGPAPTKKPLSLPDVVHDLKSLTTHRYILGVREKQWQPFPGRLWQRNYYEHIIRDEKDYLSVYDYIISNPVNWEKDEEFRQS